MPSTLAQLVFDGIPDGPVGVALDIVGTASRLARAGLVDAPCTVPRHRIVSVDGAAIRTATKRTLEVDGALARARLGAGDVLVVPGLGMATPKQIAAALERRDVARAIELVARAAARGATIAASCSATFVLAAAGVLDGREATTTWWLAGTFAQRFPRVTLRPDRMVVDADGAITAGSAFAHADLMLAILARTTSPSLAHLVAKYLVLDERDSQARYTVMEHLRVSDPVVLALERFVASNVGRQVTLDEMARATATSPRTLARKVARALGTTPQGFAQRLRIARAVHLLETTQRSVEDVAARVGYADPAAFRRVFRRETGETPRARRARARRDSSHDR
ncbi:GlxA family transcriptional regulator [Sandaracinus amylolyticus]|uniref:Transcriptional regulator, AraC family protein n=1 Tax=Sandaracinus amylolyticus TaxID=927083 RepID=A0A0F6W0R4_9BACT|nr:helix-turn-helix domain-containing protein [Sandaracinus amylolyticus]AKF04492.1 Transcriptional regulator, AraC family protein [Sandaracinus amylolyticus]